MNSRPNIDLFFLDSVLQNQGLSENIYEAILFSEILLENLQHKLFRLSNVNFMLQVEPGRVKRTIHFPKQ